jgi:hypothetical protein
LWRTGANPKPRDDGRDISRYTEIHPPDRIDIVKDPPWPETIRMAAVAAPGTFWGRPRPESTLDVTIPAPRRPAGDVELHVEEFVGPETDRDMIVQGNADRTGASITVTEHGVRLFVAVAGRRAALGGAPGRFKALYRVFWTRRAGARYAAVWEQAAGPRQEARRGLTSEQSQQTFDQLAAKGYRLLSVSGYGE